jgi:serine/threonine protein phosphatase PrpC
MAQARDALQRVNWQLCNQAGEDDVIGTTIVVLGARGDRYGVAWAGDSRLYLARAGTLRQITRDHSHVQELVDSGALTPAEARRHPQANVLTRAVGAELALDLDVAGDAIRDRDRFLLCSDGLGKDVDEGEIAALMQADEPVRRIADRLVELALTRSGVDNITVVVVSVGLADSE